MSPWLGFLLLYGFPILFIVFGIKGILTGQLGFGRDTAEGWKARVLGVVYICGGYLLAYVLYHLNKA